MNRVVKVDTNGLKRIINEVLEELSNNDNYTHFAVNKTTGKIVNGWDYSGHDGDELRMYKRDYFIVDLEDYGLKPKDYKILTRRSLDRMGINPDDNSNWANI